MTIITTRNVSAFDFDLIARVMKETFRDEERSREDFERCFRNSYVVGHFEENGGQTGWARATSDTVFHAYMMDVLVVPAYRGKGLGKRLVSELLDHPALCDVTTWMLSTHDRHDLYRPFGFRNAEPGRYMVMKKG